MNFSCHMSWRNISQHASCHDVNYHVTFFNTGGTVPMVIVKGFNFWEAQTISWVYIFVAYLV